MIPYSPDPQAVAEALDALYADYDRYDDEQIDIDLDDVERSEAMPDDWLDHLADLSIDPRIRR